jgi:methionyl-tRNA synthetase
VLSQGLRDFSVTRRQVRWGIPLPAATDEVLYVWVDALANYLTGVGFPDAPETFARWWPADTHLVGKEIIRFHCLYWPALLLSAGLPLPRRVFAHGWLTRDGQKISKTTGNVIDPAALVAEFGADAVRYYFARAIPFGRDGDFTRADFAARYTADLANDFGNLVQRASALAARHAGLVGAGPLTQAETVLRGEAAALPKRVEVAFESLALHEATGAIGGFVRAANRYIDATAPWTLAKQGDFERLGLVLDHAVEAARLAAWYYSPVLTRSAVEAHRRLTGSPPWAGQGHFSLAARGPVAVGEPLFPRMAA